MNYKKTKLKNGLRVITIPMVGTKTVTVVTMVGVGSRYETEKEAGLSHFIEHMLFKGTKKRPTALDISSELDNVGGEFNAFTSKETTGYYAKVDAKHIKIALDIIADIYLNSKIEPKEIEKEKRTILQELNMYEDMPMQNVEDVFEKLLYSGNSLGREIIGYKKTIQLFQRKDFLKYKKRFYLANDTVVCIAGKFDEKKVITQVKKYFSTMSEGSKSEIISVEEKQKMPQSKIKFKKTDQTHLSLGFRSYKQNHKDQYVLFLIAVILGGNMSSRMFIEVRERRGLAYYIKTGRESFIDCGHLTTRAGIEHKNLELAIKTILGEYRKIAQEKISFRELQRAKDYIKGKTIMGMEASDEVAMYFIEQEVTKKEVLTIEEKFELIDKVTPDDILRVAQDIIKKEKLNLAIIGPHKNNAKLKSLLKL